MRTRRALALGALCWLGAGCSWYRTHFPARDEVFKPIPLDVGERRVRGADTSWAVGGDGYELVAPDRELLPDGRRALDYAAREFTRTFGVLPPPVVVEVRWADERARRRGLVDSTYRRPDGRRALAVSVPPPPKDRRARERMLYDPPLAAVAPAVARAWLSGYADGAPPRAGASASAPGAEGPAWTLGDDPRLPDWLEDGVAALVAPSRRQDLLDAAAARSAGSLPALRALFAMSRPGAPRPRGESSPARYGAEVGAEKPRGQDPEPTAELPADRDPRRARAEAGRRVDGRMRLTAAEEFAAQSSSVVQFLARREGRAFVGRLVDRVLDGAAIEVALGDARSVPSSLDALDRTWRAWLAQREDYRNP